MSGGEEMKGKTGHLVVWVQGLVLVLLCARLGVRIVVETQGENKVTEREAQQTGGGINGEMKQQTGGGINGEMKQQTGAGISEDAQDFAGYVQEGAVLEKKKVALTFDDGPSSKYTPLLLEGLKERDVHATFFLMGKNIEGKEELVKQMQTEGHLIGNHTYNHVELCKISREAARTEIEATNQEIYDITGEYPMWLRPPYGEWQKNLDFYVNMFPVLWDIDTLDWKSQNVNAVMQIVESEIEDGAVILMHDAYQSSVDAALQIVDLLTAQGYEFVTVDELVLP